ncbi:glycosyltransferase family 39 protein [Nocardia sp. NPDC005746]|uniref:glycosyltransferase family 39 protein n=1 Tax=Nocardia sp. NPDC005746 TaxID=3157062 RepID=UPI0033F93EFC
MTSTAWRLESAAAERPDEGDAGRRETRLARVVFGADGQPRWARPGLIGLLAVTAVLYLWDLTNSGWANEYYSAAAQAGSRSWKALLFGSFDAGNAITVDKPPAALWVMGLSGKLLGFSQWSVLLPQALMGVVSVGLLAATVRRLSGPGAGLLAGAIAGLTPVAVLIFRFDNPDALLVLLLVVAAYCTVRAIQATGDRVWSAPTGWLMLAGVAVGFGFLTKMMQAFLILPGLGLAFLIAANSSLRQRVRSLALACLAVVVSAGWYIALVELWPADSRPFIGGSTDNSLWQLAVGYNGLGRILGGSGNMGSHSPGGVDAPEGMSGFAGFSGSSGLTRLFNPEMGGEISWLLPAALIGLAAGLWLTRRAPRTDRTRAAFVLWGGWLLVTGVTFSFMGGIVHPYYTVALAPAIGALVALSVRELWSRAAHPAARPTLALMAAGTGAWSFVLLNRTPDWLPWLRWTVLIGSILVALPVIAGSRASCRYAAVLALAGVLFGLGGASAWAIATAAQPHSGGNPLSGPAAAQSFGPCGAPGEDGDRFTPPSDAAPEGDPAAPSGEITTGPTDVIPVQQGGTGDGAPGNGHGPMFASANNAELVALLEHSDARWAAATVGAGSAGGLALNSGKSVMAIGGFTGSDDSPTLARFQTYVSAGQVRYFIDGGMVMGGNADSSGSQISAWVKSHFTALTVGASTVYDLSRPVTA